MKTPALTAAILFTCWFVPPLAVAGMLLIPLADAGSDASHDCIELCADWWHSLVTGVFAVVFAASALTNAVVATIKFARPRVRRQIVTVALFAVVDLLAAALWVGSVALGADLQLAEFFAGAFVAAASIALFASLLALRRDPQV